MSEVYSTEVLSRMVTKLMDEEYADTMNQWVTDFVYDMDVRMTQGNVITEKQRNKILEIFNDHVVTASSFTRGRFDCERR